MKYFVLTILVMLQFTCLEAQNAFSCSYNGTTEVINAYGFENDDLQSDAYNVSALINRILQAYNIPSKIKVIPSAQVNNAVATAKDGKPYILYSKYFVENIKHKTNGEWKLIGIFAHEVGHHILFHTLGNSSSRRDLELEADKWAGAALYKLGASLEQATTCVEETNVNGSSTHPPRAERKQAIQNGWNEAQKQGGRVEPTPPKPEPKSKVDLPDFVQMVYVEGGSFEMGDMFNTDEKDEKPIHTVNLSNYWIGATEVTQAQWVEIMGNNPSFFKDCPNCPVESISWQDTQEFLKKLNQKYPNRNYRLPTEAEWEYAARERGKKVRYGNGKNTLNMNEATFGGTEDNYVRTDAGTLPCYHDGCEYKGKTSVVKSFLPNGLGLYDMSGNVSEWCSDWYSSGYYSITNNANNPINETKPEKALIAFKVMRGGSCQDEASECRNSNRILYDTYSALREKAIPSGFRLCISH